MIDVLIRYCFGGILIASFFMLASFGSIARIEYRDARRHGNPLYADRPFMLALCLCIGALALIGVAGVRTADGFNGVPLGGSSPALLLVSLGLLWLAWSGFHWSATFDRRPSHWRLYLAMVVVWTALLAWPWIAHRL